MIILDVISWILVAVGSFACVTAGIGLIRLPDFFCRSHAGGIMDSLGMGFLFAGMALQTTDPLILVKLFFIYGFVLLTGPTAIHALTRAALHAGIQPTIGQRSGGDSSTH